MNRVSVQVKGFSSRGKVGRKVDQRDIRFAADGNFRFEIAADVGGIHFIKRWKIKQDGLDLLLNGKQAQSLNLSAKKCVWIFLLVFLEQCVPGGIDRNKPGSIAVINLLEFDLNDEMVDGEAAQKILQPDPAHEFPDKLRTTPFGKLSPRVRAAEDDKIGLLTQAAVSKVRTHLRV